MKPMTMLLLAGAAWFLLSPKKQAAAPAQQGGQPQAPSSLQECLKSQSASACAKFGFDTAGAIADAVASELKGIDGCAPASLEGHMASLGAYSGLGGSFYGSC